MKHFNNDDEIKEYFHYMPVGDGGELTHIPAISWYNHNYYHTKDGCLLFGKADDDAYIEWWLIRDTSKPLRIGESFFPINDDRQETLHVSIERY